MNTTLNKLLIFVAGAVAGSLATWKVVKTKYEQIAQEEIDSVKEAFSREKREEVEDESEIHEADERAVQDILHEQRYATYYRKEGEDMKNGPYVISPDEFGENDDYRTISLTYYADGVLTDEDDEVIDDVEDIVGIDSLSHFGEYEEDSVFVRNDGKKCDYEILADVRRYSDR